MSTPLSKLVAALTLLTTGTLANSAIRPSVVELFTSQGCSSCPPAEKIAGELARRPELLVLTYHVTYWDDLGWRDRFGLPEATQRQQAYSTALQSRSVYTPQVMIEGTRGVIGSNRGAIEHALQGVRTGIPIGLNVREGSVSIELPAQEHAQTADVVLVTYLRSAVSPIGRGENAGRTIQESNIVRSFRSLGTWSGSAKDWQVPRSSLPSDATDVAVLVQERGQRTMLAATHRAL